MKFVDYDGSIIELSEEDGNRAGLSKCITTKGRLGPMTVETKQMEIN